MQAASLSLAGHSAAPRPTLPSGAAPRPFVQPALAPMPAHHTHRRGATSEDPAPLLGVAHAMPLTEKITADLPIPAEVRSRMPSWAALALYAATHVAPKLGFSFVPTTQLLFNGLAGYSLLWSTLSALSRRVDADRIGNIVGPIFLAVQALGGLGGRLTGWDTATALFGWLVHSHLPAFPYSSVAWLGSLGAAIYSGLGSQWLVGAFGLAAFWRLLRAWQENQSLRIQELPFIGLALWAFMKKVETPVALTIMLGELVASALF